MDLTFIGYFAVVCTGTQLIPEVIKALKTHHLRDVAWGMLLLHGIGAVSWLIYGSFIGDIPLMISASMNTLLGTTLIILKYQYAKTEQPMLSKKAGFSKAE